MLSAVLSCLCLAVCDGELSAWLQRAGSGDWAERERAQRWLATHLETADAGAVAARAASGDPEVRARLARAIGGQARLLGLAANLCLCGDAAGVELGREALREQILDFDPGAEDLPSELPEWLTELRLRFPEQLALSAELRAGHLDPLLDTASRRVSGAPPLVLDPRASIRSTLVDASRFEGTLAELLLQCVSEHGSQVLGFGFGPESTGLPWILVAPVESARRTAAEFVATWVIGVADPARETYERRADASALAATGWPAALEFLERRWIGGDEAALDGLLLAAGRGRVVPTLQDPKWQRMLYAQLAGLAQEEHDRGAPALASAIARALGTAGPLSRTGEPLGALALEGFEHAAPREQWLRLVVLTGQGRAFPEALGAADAVLAAAASPAALVVEALRLRAALAGASPLPHPPANPLALLDWAADPRRRAELRSLWSGLALGWPAQWNGVAARLTELPAETHGLLLELAWLAGAREPALAEARVLCADHSARAFDALGAALADLALHSKESARSLADALPSGSEAEASHSSAAALLAGLAPSAKDEARIARWLAAGPGNPEELLALSSQAASARGALVRAKLIELSGSAFELDARVAALERAARELAEQGAETELESFASAARERARTLGQTDLRTRLRPGRWPKPARGPARDLERDERELERW